MKVQVLASVRKVGAIGNDYSQEFLVEAPEGSSIHTLKELWFSQYGDEWELYNFISFGGTVHKITVTQEERTAILNQVAKGIFWAKELLELLDSHRQKNPTSNDLVHELTGDDLGTLRGIGHYSDFHWDGLPVAFQHKINDMLKVAPYGWGNSHCYTCGQLFEKSGDRRGHWPKYVCIACEGDKRDQYVGE